MSTREGAMPVPENQKFPIYTSYMPIGPTRASEFLAKNTRNYRKLSLHKADRFARDMREGRWVTTHQGIAFDREGCLADGQHRLLAVVKSGCEVLMAVTYNVSLNAASYMDMGDSRSVRTILTAQKIEGIKNVHTAIARLLCGRLGMASNVPTKTQQVEMFFRHEAAIRAAVGLVPDAKKRVEIAGVLTPMARAWYSADRPKLEEFASLLAYGFLDGVEMVTARPVLVLRDYLLSLKHVSGAQATQEIYCKTERALCAYLKGESLTRIVPVKEEIFPLPEETEAAE